MLESAKEASLAVAVTKTIRDRHKPLKMIPSNLFPRQSRSPRNPHCWLTTTSMISILYYCDVTKAQLKPWPQTPQTYNRPKCRVDLGVNSKTKLVSALAFLASFPASKVSWRQWRKEKLAQKTFLCRLRLKKMGRWTISLRSRIRKDPFIPSCRTREAVSSRTLRVLTY